MKRAIPLALAMIASCATSVVALSGDADSKPARAPITARFATFCEPSGETMVQVTVFNPSTTGRSKMYSIGWTYKPEQNGQLGLSSHLQPQETYLFEKTVPPGSSIHVKVATDNYVEFSDHPLVNRTVKGHCK